ncbi:MAG: hypothetical protein ABSG70_05685 [Terriglobales bacterium]|jgi:hypothetical protein
MRIKVLAAAILIMAVGVGRMLAEVKYPAETRNAALRYWMAFAEMQDAWADKTTQELLQKTAAGEAAWDETKLGPILDANIDAIHMMQRATKLPECDWGLEYGRGWKASIAYAPRARALARLNTLEGMRQLAKGDSVAATNAWLAGIRFSRDLTRGGGLIFALMAKSALMSNLRLLTEAGRKGQLDEAQKKQIFAAVKALPEDGLDWREAWGIETSTTEEVLQELRTAKDPDAAYEAIMGKPVPKQGLPPSAQEIQLYREYMLAAQAALRESPVKAKSLLDGLEAKKSSLDEVERNLIPSLQNTNAARIEVLTTRAELLQALGGK